MKTQKQLPELFYIQENEKTNEYCERLRINIDELIPEEDYGDYSVFKDGKFINAYYKKNLDVLKEHYPKAVFVDLADYIDQEQPKQKWQPLTRGGLKFNIIREDRGDGIMSVEIFKDDNTWMVEYFYKNGRFLKSVFHDYDLLPINHELTTLEKELEEVRTKEKQILEKIKQLKK